MARWNFVLETASPRAILVITVGRGGAPAPLDVLLERDAKECHDDASAGDKGAAQRS
jgi:hypothetical protein